MSKNRLIEFETSKGEKILFEVDGELLSTWEDVGDDTDNLITKAKSKLSDSLDVITYLGEILKDKTRGIAPKKTEIEFGLSFEIGSTVIIKAGSSANIKIKMTWENGNENNSSGKDH